MSNSCTNSNYLKQRNGSIALDFSFCSIFPYYFSVHRILLSFRQIDLIIILNNKSFRLTAIIFNDIRSFKNEIDPTIRENKNTF